MVWRWKRGSAIRLDQPHALDVVFSRDPSMAWLSRIPVGSWNERLGDGALDLAAVAAGIFGVHVMVWQGWLVAGLGNAITMGRPGAEPGRSAGELANQRRRGATARGRIGLDAWLAISA